MMKNWVSLILIGVFCISACLLLAEDKDGGGVIDNHPTAPPPDPSNKTSSPSPSPCGALPVFESSTPPDRLISPSPSPSVDSAVSASPTPVPITSKQEVSGGFTRYIPDHNGDMEWKLEGDSVKFLSPTCLEIMDMKANSLSPKIGYLSISAGKVLYYTESKKAQADGERIIVRRENMVLTGKGFLWSPNLEQIRVSEDVKVLIKEKGNIGLFPL